MTIQAHKVRTELGKHINTDGLNQIFDFEKSHGSWLVDKSSGKKFLDCFGQYASLPVGYNHTSLIEKRQQIDSVSLCKIVNSDLYSCEYADFVETFSSIFPEEFKHFFFIEGGSAAVENALKVAFDWKAKKMDLSDALAQNLDIIHLEKAFHGRGGYTLSLTNTGHVKTDFFPRFPWTRVTSPSVIFPLDAELILGREEQSLIQIETALKKGNVAAFIMEPIQSEGGHNMFRVGYFKQVKDLCDQYDCLLIFDEVQTGMGASGKWWAFEHYEVTPDIVIFGKKAQVCGIATTTNKIDQVELNCFKQSGRINSTWGGSIVDMVRSDLLIKIIKKEKLVEQTAEVGSYFISKLREIEAISAVVSNTRGLGTLIAFDLPNVDIKKKILHKLNENLVILGCGERSVRFRPALTFSQQDADVALDYLRKALK